MRAKLRLLSGETLEGELAAPFTPDAPRIVLATPGAERIVENPARHAAWIAFWEKEISRPEGLEPLDVVSVHGERFAVEVLATDVHPQGFFAWPRQPKPEDPTRWFFFRAGVRHLERPQKIGEILVSEGLASADAVRAGLVRQKELAKRLGEMLGARGTASKQKEEKRRKRIGEILLEKGLVEEQELQKALEQQKEERRRRKRLGEILLEEGKVDEERLVRALAAKFHLPVVDLDAPDAVDPQAAYAVPEALVRKHEWLPIRLQDDELVVATSDPVDNEAYDDFRFVSGKRLRLVLARPSQIRRHISELFSDWEEADALVIESAPEEEDRVEVGEEVDAPPIVRLVNRMIVRGLERGASDIHLLPQEDAFVLAYRIDGDLREETRFRGELGPKLVSRIKVLARMDIAEHRLPQDGRLLLRWRGTPYELRVSLIPNVYGESIVMRVLGREELVDVRKIGLRDEDRTRLLELVRKPFGMILVTGPTGSGKSTTLFALIKEVAKHPVHVLTIEDPVEYRHRGVNQIEVQPKAGLTFARVLRNVLRHDPDVVLVGEIRDEETAEIALRASLTGHLLLSTLHTNSAADTVLRLVDMGARPFLIAEALLAVSSQNLLKRLCPHCRKPQALPARARKLLQGLGLDAPEKVWTAEGCAACEGTGTKGRVLLYELMIMTERLRKAVHDGVVGKELEAVAVEEGMVPKARYLVELLGRGEVGWEEAVRYLL